MMSPLMSSMDVASRRDCASAEFTFTPCMPLVDSPAGLLILKRMSCCDGNLGEILAGHVIHVTLQRMWFEPREDAGDMKAVRALKRRKGLPRSVYAYKTPPVNCRNKADQARKNGWLSSLSVVCTGSQRLTLRGSQQRSFSVEWLSGEWARSGDAPPSTPQSSVLAAGPQSGYFADGESCAAASFCSSPAASGRTILLGEGESGAAAASRIGNPFAGAGGPPVGELPPSQPPPPTWNAATAACWGHPEPDQATHRSAPVQPCTDHGPCQDT